MLSNRRKLDTYLSEVGDHKRRQAWCVGTCSDETREYQFKVFEDEASAQAWADYLKQRGGFNVFIWEL